MNNSIFLPMIAMVILTTVIWLLVYRRRVGELRTSRINPQTLATSETASRALKDVSAADNFRNLFEVPVLFYVICICLEITGGVTTIQLILAWLFVALRIVHSYIHVTYNRVMHRFTVYVLSCVCVFTMWGIFTVSQLATGIG